MEDIDYTDDIFDNLWIKKCFNERQFAKQNEWNDNVTNQVAIFFN